MPALDGESQSTLTPRAHPRSYAVGDRNAASWSCAYDNEGNLFVADATRLLELPKGATRFKNIAWNGMRPARLGPIQWDGKYLAASSRASGSRPATISRYRVSDGRATLVGETALKGAESPVQFWIDGGAVVVPTLAGLALYDYPLGGAPTQVIKDARDAVAAAISRASKPRGVSVVTYHYDNLRTGWDDSESSLSYQNVKNGSFGLLHTVTLDDQVSTQPLVVSNASRKGVRSSSAARRCICRNGKQYHLRNRRSDREDSLFTEFGSTRFSRPWVVPPMGQTLESTERRLLT